MRLVSTCTSWSRSAWTVGPSADHGAYLGAPRRVERDRALDDLVELDAGRLRRGEPRELGELGDDLGDAMDLLEHGARRFVEILVEGGIGARAQAAQRFDRGANRRERILDLVGDEPRDLAAGRDALGRRRGACAAAPDLRCALLKAWAKSSSSRPPRASTGRGSPRTTSPAWLRQRFQRACDGCARARWPPPAATTTVMADAKTMRSSTEVEARLEWPLGNRRHHPQAREARGSERRRAVSLRARRAGAWRPSQRWKA